MRTPRSESSSPRKRADSITDINVEYSYRDRIDPTLRFLYKPHTVTVMLLIIAGLVYVAFFQTVSNSSVNSIRYTGLLILHFSVTDLPSFIEG